jgi:hypothetical protein
MSLFYTPDGRLTEIPDSWELAGYDYAGDPYFLRPEKEIYGYKAFAKNWTCRDKQYTCPGEFKTTNGVSLCQHGMHFCEKIDDVFMYYGPILQEIKIAEVIAHGSIVSGLDKSCTDKLTIVRQLSIDEILKKIESNCIARNVACYSRLILLYDSTSKKIGYTTLDGCKTVFFDDRARDNFRGMYV